MAMESTISLLRTGTRPDRVGVVIVLGKFPAQALFRPPSPFRTHPNHHDHGTECRRFFGGRRSRVWALLCNGGNTLIVTARFFNARAGRVYAFHGQSGTSGAIPLGSADNVSDGPAANCKYGDYLALLGPEQ